MKIPENILEDILGRIDIVEIISGYIPLKRSGRNFKAPCPFHHEKTPSFMVSADRQIYHCFGCHKGGNVFRFLMDYERMEFPEAVEMLAKKCGVVLPESKPQDPKATNFITQLYKLNELAAGFYEQGLSLAPGAQAKDYLLKRGIKEESLKLFKLGFAADKWDGLITYLRAKGVPLSLLEKAGLVLSKEGGGYYDRFRNRVIFPIFDIKSRVLAFGARVLPALSRGEGDNSLPKYLNSPETPVYTKGKHLYGLNFAKDAIRDNDYAVIVEGYLDFLMPYQEGVQNIVASLGTALTPEQARALKRYTHNIVMVYDPDKAGEMATLRSLDIFIEEGMNVKVVSLPEGLDPDLFVRQNGAQGFREKILAAKSLFDYKLGILKLRHNAKDVEGKSNIAAAMLPTINKFEDAVTKSEYIKKLSQELSVTETALWEELKKIKDGRLAVDFSRGQTKKAIDINPTEKMLIKMMLEAPGLARYVKENLIPEDFKDERASRIVSLLFNFIEQGKEMGPSVLVNHIDEEDIAQFICESAFLDVAQENKEKVVENCVCRMKDERLKNRRQNLHEEIKRAQALGDEEKLNILMQEFHNLIKKG
ncbi:MAG: DNA primase [Candidatus Omnitrophota bacterium]